MDAARDSRQALWAVIDRVHARDYRQQHLRSADIAGRLLAPDVLLAGLERHSQRRFAVRIARHADDASGNLPLDLVAGREVRGVRPAVAEWHAEALGVADDNVRSPLARRSQQH